MEFMNRSAQPAPRPTQSSTASASTGSSAKSSRSWQGSPLWLRVFWVVLLFGATILAVSIVALLYFGGTKEQSYLDKSKNQAVFLSNGQVYFGKIQAVNKQFINLTGIYYLNVSQQVQPDQKSASSSQASSVSLVKLGCELHGPVDQMVINRDQVTFWENLKSDGQVSDAIKKWRDQNPNGQKCAAATDSTKSTNP